MELIKHSIDSVASYSSQNHVDRIRSKHFSSYTGRDEEEWQSKHNRFKQQRSLSNLEFTYSKRPESVISSTSSTGSRLRDFVDRKTHDEQKSSDNKTADIEYFENPTETLEFNNQRTNSKKNQSGKKKLSRTSKEGKCYADPIETKPRKHEKYQSKLAEYYNLPKHLPQDEFYQHLTRSRASSEGIIDRRLTKSSSDAEFNAILANICQQKEPEGGNLRRSRSLAVIREETFTDLQLQGHSKSKRSQLIPRARLFDKPGFKDRLPVRTKNPTEEVGLERIYSRSTNSSSADNTILSEETCDKVLVPCTKEILKDAKNITVPKLKSNQQTIGGSWPNIADPQNISKPYRELSEDSINYSRNPSEIDSLDSNYVRKHYNFEAHNRTANYKESSPDNTESVTSPLDKQFGKTLFIYEDDNIEAGKVHSSDISLPNYFHEHKYDTDKSISNDSVSVPNSDKSRDDFTVLDREIHNYDLDSYDEVSVNDKFLDRSPSIDTQTITKSTSRRDQTVDTRFVESEHEDTISTPPDSITSYVSISIPSSTEKSRKLENLANSLAEKIDEYCETKFSDIPLKELGQIYKIKSDVSSIYNRISKSKSKLGTKDLKKAEHLNHQKAVNENQLYTQYHNKYISHNSVAPGADDFKTRSLYRQSSSSKNITTEPFVTTLIENQYYSLPDINISKSLRKSERIDAKLREEDLEDLLPENAYETANNLIENALIEEETNAGAIPESANCGQLTVSDYSLSKNNRKKPAAKTIPIITSDNNIEPIQSLNITTDILKQPTPCSTQGITSVVTVDGVIIEVEKDNKFSLVTVDNNIHTQKDHINTPKAEPKDQELFCNHQEHNFKETCTTSIPSSIDGKVTSDSERESKFLNGKAKASTGIKKHYSLRQRDPKKQEVDNLPSLDTAEFTKASQVEHIPIKTPDTLVINLDKNTKLHSSVIACIAPYNKSIDSNIAIVPLGGHQTIVINPLTVKKNYNNDVALKRQRKEINKLIGVGRHKSIHLADKLNEKTNDELKMTHVEQPVKATVTKVKKDTSEKIAAVQHKFEKPPSRLIIKDNKKIPTKFVLRTTSKMTRPQILHVVHGKQVYKPSQGNTEKNGNFNINNEKLDKVSKEEVSRTSSDISNKSVLDKIENTHVHDKINRVVKTDLEYQEKLNSVKSYWSKLIDNTKGTKVEEETTGPKSKKPSMLTLPIDETYVQNKKLSNVSDLVQSMETVKIVDSIKKSNSETEIWKNEMEKVKDDSEIEESTLKKIVKEYDDRNNALSSFTYNNSKTPTTGLKSNTLLRTSPDIEIVELGSDDNKEKTQATIIKSKSYSKDCTDFDHVRYRVMKSELFRNSMIANYRKEAQFDGLLQYLQDYSFQELLVKNHIVIIEPVRTKIEQKIAVCNNSTKPTSYRINPNTFRKDDKEDDSEKSNSRSGIRRHFFYHPIRINKEIIEEELPNPDTVKKVRNLFEDTLKMRSPDNSCKPLTKLNVSKRSSSYKNLAEDSDKSKNGTRKTVMRYLTVDTSYGSKKWDSASLSSGVSSGDLSSINDYVSDHFSPVLNRKHGNTIYSSSSEEYLYESVNHGLYESQYVSQEILRKIRDCGTSITYYGGKVLDKKTGPAVSPMTKAIMEEIRGLQKNCSRDCVTCQTRCLGRKCVCLNTEQTYKDNLTTPDKNRCSCNSSDSGNQEQTRPNLVDRNGDSYVGIKFKLVKSNSCSSRLELSGTDDIKNLRHRYRNKRPSLEEKRSSIDDPPIIYDVENSVKNKICRIESYKKGIANSPFNEKKKVTMRLSENDLANMKEETMKDERYSEVSENTTTDKSCPTDLTETIGNEVRKVDTKSSYLNVVAKKSESKTEDAKSEVCDDANKEDDATKNDTIFDKKYYYVNDNKNGSSGKFGEMIFEEFEVLESCYDSLNSTRSNNK